MAAIASPYGLKPINRIGGTPFSGAARQVACTTNNATGIFFGDMVSVNSGVPTAVVATPTTTRGVTTPTGVFVGCEYVNAQGSKVYSQYLPANSISGGATSVFIYIAEDPDQLFQIQANGTVTAASIGKNAALTFGTVGSTTTGNSGVKLDQATIAVTATLAVRIVDLVNLVGVSVPGDAFTDCIVCWNIGVHAYRNATGA